MKLDLESIRNLAENIEKYGLSEVAVETGGVRVVMKKERPGVPAEAVKYGAPDQPVRADKTPAEAAEKKKESAFETIDAPMVGTFYRSPAPGGEPFVREGDEVLAGAALCILEAMKLMNEVKAPKNCKIVKVLAEDGQIVRKGDQLFAVK